MARRRDDNSTNEDHFGIPGRKKHSIWSAVAAIVVAVVFFGLFYFFWR